MRFVPPPVAVARPSAYAVVRLLGCRPPSNKHLVTLCALLEMTQFYKNQDRGVTGSKYALSGYASFVDSPIISAPSSKSLSKWESDGVAFQFADIASPIPCSFIEVQR
jgi:hypothetical protein